MKTYQFLTIYILLGASLIYTMITRAELSDVYNKLTYIQYSDICMNNIRDKYYIPHAYDQELASKCSIYLEMKEQEIKDYIDNTIKQENKGK